MSSSDNELIDHDVFSQILDMDEEGDNEFSRSIVYNYFEQAENTFSEMDAALKQGDLPNLSRLGHFLKGSSAALGVKNVKIMCERIQHYGSLKDDTGVNPIEEKNAINLITDCLETAKEEYYTANSYLKDFYEELEDELGEEEEEEDGETPVVEEVEAPTKEETSKIEVFSDSDLTSKTTTETGVLVGSSLPETTQSSA